MAKSFVKRVSRSVLDGRSFLVVSRESRANPQTPKFVKYASGFEV